MYCIYCGKTLPDEAEFCYCCGKPVWSDNLEEPKGLEEPEVNQSISLKEVQQKAVFFYGDEQVQPPKTLHYPSTHHKEDEDMQEEQSRSFYQFILAISIVTCFIGVSMTLKGSDAWNDTLYGWGIFVAIVGGIGFIISVIKLHTANKT